MFPCLMFISVINGTLNRPSSPSSSPPTTSAASTPKNRPPHSSSTSLSTSWSLSSPSCTVRAAWGDCRAGRALGAPIPMAGGRLADGERFRCWCLRGSGWGREPFWGELFIDLAESIGFFWFFVSVCANFFFDTGLCIWCCFVSGAVSLTARGWDGRRGDCPLGRSSLRSRSNFSGNRRGKEGRGLFERG